MKELSIIDDFISNTYSSTDIEIIFANLRPLRTGGAYASPAERIWQVTFPTMYRPGMATETIKVDWSANVPANTALTIELALGSPSGPPVWIPLTNGVYLDEYFYGRQPSYSTNPSNNVLHSKAATFPDDNTIYFRQTLETTDPFVYAELTDFEVSGFYNDGPVPYYELNCDRDGVYETLGADLGDTSINNYEIVENPLDSDLDFITGEKAPATSEIKYSPHVVRSTGTNLLHYIMNGVHPSFAYQLAISIRLRFRFENLPVAGRYYSIVARGEGSTNYQFALVMDDSGFLHFYCKFKDGTEEEYHNIGSAALLPEVVYTIDIEPKRVGSVLRLKLLVQTTHLLIIDEILKSVPYTTPSDIEQLAYYVLPTTSYLYGFYCGYTYIHLGISIWFWHPGEYILPSYGWGISINQYDSTNYHSRLNWDFRTLPSYPRQSVTALDPVTALTVNLYADGMQIYEHRDKWYLPLWNDLPVWSFYIDTLRLENINSITVSGKVTYPTRVEPGDDKSAVSINIYNDTLTNQYPLLEDYEVARIDTCIIEGDQLVGYVDTGNLVSSLSGSFQPAVLVRVLRFTFEMKSTYGYAPQIEWLKVRISNHNVDKIVRVV